jgi:copper chaperone NosL
MRLLTAQPALLLVAVLACTRSPPGPAPLDTRNEACAQCRMLVSDGHLASQLVTPGEEPLFFDDLGCLARYLAQHSPRRAAVAYVADHRTLAWVRASKAVYTLQPSLSTPMNSHLLAHRDEASRDADPASAGGRSLSTQDVLGPSGPPEGP